MSTSNENDQTAAAEGVDDLVIDRSCITCEKCGVVSPQKCCGRCGSFYYCSKECQVQDWKRHKQTCSLLKKQHDLWKEDRSNVLPDSNILDAKEGPCAICLEETISNPVSLPCGHEFCFECIGEYQFSPNSDNPSSCPYCRGEIPNVVKKSLDINLLYTKRAMHSRKGSAEQKKYARLALAEYNTAEKIFNVKGKGNNEADNGEMDVGVMFMRSVVGAMAGQPEETIKITNKTLSLNDRYPGHMEYYQVQEVRHLQAEAYSELGKWEEAEKIYTSIYRELLL